MERRFTQSATGAHSAAEPPVPLARDIHWAVERRTAIGVASLLYAALLAMDASGGRLDAARGALWAGLAALVFVILLPSRVSVGPGLLSARGLLVEHTVRTDSLVSVRWTDGVAQRMILRDTEGNRAEIDPTVLVRNPAMWHRFDVDARTSIRQGTLRHGAIALCELTERINRETALTVFRASGLR
ncbi:hypothetical protein [Streptomyces sp. NBC_01264]|uniref:hypothetical protein n=1 Tax=Streptomyces sp. NBC_01264 TaxID=2903804 RepID=UPI002253CAB3|nr:hypothetical protein [Streptomyces sp. NBC_01264]MCX4776254.1 hypothetical protein [Streptomyces sp. NBC_01264]